MAKKKTKHLQDTLDKKKKREDEAARVKKALKRKRQRKSGAKFI